MIPARFTAGSLPRQLLAMAGASGAGQLALFLVDILTLTYVAMLHDQTLLAAVGLAKTLVFVNAAFASGVVIAGGVVLSERIGRHAGQRRGRLVSHLLVLALAIAAGVALLELLCVAPVSRWLGADTQAFAQAQHFIWLALPASVLQAGMQMCAQLLKAQGLVRLALVLLLCGAGSLALADPLLIFACGLGLDGAALAYALSSLLSLLVGLVLVKRHIGLSLPRSARLLALHMGRTLRVALPVMLGNLAMPVGITCLMLTMAAQGAAALAGMTVVDRVLQLAYCVFFALPGALVPVLAQNIGAGCDVRAARAIVISRRLVLLYGVAVWLLLIVCGPAIADHFELVDSGRAVFLAMCHYGAGFWLLAGLDFVAQATFLTIGRAWWVPTLGWLRGTLGSVPFVLVGARYGGAPGALVGMWCGNGLVAVAAVWLAARQARAFFALRRAMFNDRKEAYVHD
ncbi:MATE family efflux transporter [Pseudomonas sp. HR96]|uniref:MATE family efflux transporter n=1 Tax=Pseudomonas sp. HR96 TaxID=1027966 RepID=UPI0039BE373C